MKYLLSFILFGLLTIGLWACSDKDEIPESDALTETIWSQTEGQRSDTFYFGINHECTVEWRYEGMDPVKQEYRYSYKAPNVTIETGANTFTGRIDGDVLSIHIFDRDLALKKVR